MHIINGGIEIVKDGNLTEEFIKELKKGKDKIKLKFPFKATKFKASKKVDQFFLDKIKEK